MNWPGNGYWATWKKSELPRSLPFSSRLKNWKLLPSPKISENLLNLLFHSSEAIVGGSPYNKSEADLAAFYDRLGRALKYMTQDLGAEPLTFAEFRDRFVRAGSGDRSRATA